MGRTGRIAKATGLATGLLLAGTVILWARVPSDDGSLGADVIVAVVPSGELAVSPSGPIIVGAGLEPGRELSSDVTVLNQTGSALHVQVRGVSANGVLDEQLMVRVTSDGADLFEGTLSGFRDWSTAGFDLQPGADRAVDVSAWIAEDATGWSGRVEQVSLEFLSTPIGAST